MPGVLNALFVIHKSDGMSAKLWSFFVKVEAALELELELETIFSGK